ncbi:MAG: DUF4423 domain-containing protein [Bdellovibrionaceae bacterium]|jgi:hypothetical protein|nr:DUF4423 domain-containing protein [Pseudobdellovibrionaceae bacterium]
MELTLDNETQEPESQLASGLNLKKINDQMSGNLVWQAVYALIGYSEKTSSLKWLSQQLDVDLEEVNNAIEGLIRLKLISKSEQGYKKSQNSTLYFKIANCPESELLKHHIAVSRQTLNLLQPDNINTYLREVTISNKEILAELHQAVYKVFLEFGSKSKSLSKSEDDGVYSLTFTATQTMALNNKGDL